MIFLLLLFGVPTLVLGGVYVVVRARAKRRVAADPQSGGGDQAARREEAIRLPYRYAHGSIFVHGRTVWTGVRLVPTTDEFLPDEKLHQMVDGATRAAANIVGPDETEVQCRVTHRPGAWEQWAETVIAKAWNPTRNFATMVRRIAGALASSGTSRPEVYLLVKVAVMDRSGTGVGPSLTAVTGGVADEQFSPALVASWESAAAEVHGKLRSMNVEPMTQADLMWLIRKPLFGSMNPAVDDSGASRPWGRGDFLMAAEVSGTNRKTHMELQQTNEDPNHPYLAVGESGTVYVTHLVVSDWPADMPFNHHSAWLRSLAAMGCEVNYRMTLLPKSKYQEAAKRIAGNLRDEAKDMESGGRSVDGPFADQLDRSQFLVERADTARGVTGVRGQIMIALSSDNLADLEEQRRYVTNYLHSELQVTVERPRRYQWRMLQSFLPGPGPDLLNLPYVRLSETSTFGIGLPSAGTALGDAVGWDKARKNTLGWVGNYVGFGVGGVPVHFTAHVGLGRDQGAGIAIIGASGSGKSSLALNMFLWESESGVECVALDPKTDFARMCYYLAFGAQVLDPEFDAAAKEGTVGEPGSKFQPINKEFWADTRIIDIANAGRGAFDPYQTSKTFARGDTLARTMFELFLGPDDYAVCRLPLEQARADARTAYQQRMNDATKAVQEGAAPQKVALPTMWEIVDRVQAELDQAIANDAPYEAVKELKQAASVLNNLREMQYAALVFAKEPQGLGVTRVRRTVYTMRGMKRPASPDSSMWDQTERLTGTILYALTDLTSQLLDIHEEANPVTGRIGTRPKMAEIDEAMAVTGFTQGANMVQTMMTQGRAYGLVVVLIDQQAARLAKIDAAAKDSGETAGNQFQAVFAFSQRTQSEAAKAMPLLGLEQNPEASVALLKEASGGLLSTGKCLFRDVDSRVGTLDVDLVFREVLAATDTNPQTRTIKQSVNPPADVADWEMLADDDKDNAVLAADAAAEAAALSEGIDRPVDAALEVAGQVTQ